MRFGALRRSPYLGGSLRDFDASPALTIPGLDAVIDIGILHDAEMIGFIIWSFNPGAGRDPAPSSLQAHLEDMAIWTAAGMPCPAE